MQNPMPVFCCKSKHRTAWGPHPGCISFLLFYQRVPNGTGFQGTLAAAGDKGMGDLSPNPAAAGIGGGICQVDTIAGIRMAYPFLVFSLMGRPTSYKPVFPPKPPGCAVRYSLLLPGSRPVPPGSGADLDKRRSCCFGERKYFSSASLIKISDKIHPFSGLGDPKIFAVKHLPFHKIPQSVQRMEDGRKRPAPVMVKQSGYVFKQQIRRSFCLSQPGNFKEQGTSWVRESSTVSSN